jgi:hypothetical protein
MATCKIYKRLHLCEYIPKMLCYIIEERETIKCRYVPHYNYGCVDRTEGGCGCGVGVGVGMGESESSLHPPTPTSTHTYPPTPTPTILLWLKIFANHLLLTALYVYSSLPVHRLGILPTLCVNFETEIGII